MARPSKPWFRASKGKWYVTINGKKVSLDVQGEDNKAEALQAWHRLMAGVSEVRSTPSEAETSVGDIIKQFLADCESRVKEKTLRWYADFLIPFAQQWGKHQASALTPVQAEAYSRKPEWGSATRAGFLGTLVTAFRWAMRARLLTSNPLLGVKSFEVGGGVCIRVT